MRGFWAGYFANRAAPLGLVDAGLVTAAFYNFHPDMVARAVPGCWQVANPADLVVRRAAAAATALTELCSEDSLRQLIAVQPVLGQAIEGCGGEGRVLSSANRAVGASLAARLAEHGASAVVRQVAEAWQACTTLREHRGDAHVAALLSHAVGGVEAHLLAAAALAIPVETLRDNRGWSEDDWRIGLAELEVRGLVQADGAATPNGFSLHYSVESLTDRLGEVPFAPLVDTDVGALYDALRRCASEIQASGLFPFPNPMGLPQLA